MPLADLLSWGHENSLPSQMLPTSYDCTEYGGAPCGGVTELYRELLGDGGVRRDANNTTVCTYTDPWLAQY